MPNVIPGRRKCANRGAIEAVELGHRHPTFVFVGSYRRKVSMSGVLRMPKDWLPDIGFPSGIYFVRDNAVGRNCLVPAWEFAACGKAMQRTAVKLEVGASGLIDFGEGLVRFVPRGSSVTLRGCIRYIEICAGSWKTGKSSSP